MQYILTEEEYEDLKDEARSGYTKKQQKQLFKLAHYLAENMPINSWKGKGEPWNCVYDENGKEHEEEWYCDECPARLICPKEQHYSQ